MMRRLGLALLVLAALVPGAAAAEEATPRFYVDINFTRSGGDVDAAVGTVAIREATTTSPLYHVRENVTLEVVAENGTVLLSGPVPVSFVEYANTYPPSDAETSNATGAELYLPYSREAVRLRVHHAGDLIADVNLVDRLCTADGTCSSYCDGRAVDVDCTCGDGTCQAVEDAQSCAADCVTSRPGGGDDGGGDGGTDGGGGGLDTGTIALYLVVGLVAVGLIVYLARRVETA